MWSFIPVLWDVLWILVLPPPRKINYGKKNRSCRHDSHLCYEFEEHSCERIRTNGSISTQQCWDIIRFNHVGLSVIWITLVIFLVVFTYGYGCPRNNSFAFTDLLCKRKTLQASSLKHFVCLWFVFLSLLWLSPVERNSVWGSDITPAKQKKVAIFRCFLKYAVSNIYLVLNLSSLVTLYGFCMPSVSCCFSG